VLAAGAADGSGADAALAELCLTYWDPLYAFVRRRGSAHHDAEDLTQSFFGKLLEKTYLGAASRERGRFRTFLLASSQHFLANKWDKRSATKRRGMGAVYEAEQLESGCRVSLKVLSQKLDSDDARKQFIREGRLAASINHPNSAYVFGTEEIEETPAISMEIVPGETLQEKVRREGLLPIASPGRDHAPRSDLDGLRRCGGYSSSNTRLRASWRERGWCQGKGLVGSAGSNGQEIPWPTPACLWDPASRL